MLTPIDIQKQDFGVKLRGYNADEVDDFLDMVGSDYEKLYKENIELRDKVSSLAKDVEKYKAMEDTLQNSIILAQGAAEDIKKNASERADNIISEAHNKSEDILRQINADILAKKNELSGMKMEVESYKTRIKGICAGLLEMLDKIE